MELAINMGLGGWLLLIAGAIAFGVAAQFLGRAETRYEWPVDAFAAGIGALVASEFIVAWRTIEPVIDGLALLPALVGGLVVGILVALLTRRLTGGTYFGRPMAAA